MSTVDLSTPPPPAASLLDGLPRRVALTLPELRAAAARAGDAPLPFDVDAPQAGALDNRMGLSRVGAEDAAYLAALDSLHEPVDSLTRRGLITGGELDSGLAGAIGLLATPATALDADVRVGSIQAKAWHRASGKAVASLATVDGIVFELAWYDAPQWAGELGRIPVIPEEAVIGASKVPERLDLPFELLSAANEAFRSNRADLLDVLIATHTGQVLDAGGRPFSDAEVQQLLGALHDEVQGRMRLMVTSLEDADSPVVGVASWVLLTDGWRAFRPHHTDGEPRVELRRVEPADLAAELAPVLAEVTR